MIKNLRNKFLTNNNNFKNTFLIILAIGLLTNFTSCTNKNQLSQVGQSLTTNINESSEQKQEVSSQSGSNQKPSQRVQGDYFEHGYQFLSEGDKDLSDEVLNIFDMIRKTIIYTDTFNQDCDHLKLALDSLQKDVESHTGLTVTYKMAKLNNEIRVFISIGKSCYPSGYLNEYSDNFVIPILQ